MSAYRLEAIAVAVVASLFLAAVAVHYWQFIEVG